MSETVWIIGVGKFGLRAARKLRQKDGQMQMHLVDPSTENLSLAAGLSCTTEKTDGIAYLVEHLHSQTHPDWIIPALPLHLAAEWCLVRLHDEGLRRIAVPETLQSLLPNPSVGSDGNLYVSHANFTCPENCNEPSDICTVTQKPRPTDMFALLADIQVEYLPSIVIRSHQLGPGIGGYRPKQLFDLFEKVKKMRGDFILATSCRCHGVITGLTMQGS